MTLDWHSIAERIRGLIRLDPSTNVAVVATVLGVDEQALRMSVDGRAPLPTASVISALVRVYGLDPSWVLTGDYDPASHRAALESDPEDIEPLVRRMIAESTSISWDVSSPTRDAARHAAEERDRGT